ncbi:hypothetical protein DsansV1_C11g0108451 [Dioscorea sansibarensis]
MFLPLKLLTRSKEFFSQISVLNNVIKACIEEMEHHKGKLSKGSPKCCAFHRNILSLNCWMLLPLSYFICPFAEAGLVNLRSGKKVSKRDDKLLAEHISKLVSANEVGGDDESE